MRISSTIINLSLKRELVRSVNDFNFLKVDYRTEELKDKFCILSSHKIKLFSSKDKDTKIVMMVCF